MKIAEIEEKLIQGECTAEMLEAFKAALKRVPQAGRCQHCYTTAAAMPEKYREQASELIQYGLKEHCGFWLDRMRSFYNLALIHEKRDDYASAWEMYMRALGSVPENKYEAYAPELALHIMIAEMHVRNFEYSDELKKYYDIYRQGSGFGGGLSKSLFYTFLAEHIIFSHENRPDEAKAALGAAGKLLQPEHRGPLDSVLRRHSCSDEVGASKLAEEFLKRTGRRF